MSSIIQLWTLVLSVLNVAATQDLLLQPHSRGSIRHYRPYVYGEHQTSGYYGRDDLASRIYYVPKRPSDDNVPNEEPTESHRGTEVAPYVVQRATEHYEVREYLPKAWVCTQPQDNVSPYATLRKYIGGKNSEGAEIPMTTPVAKLYENGKLTEYCFYISKDYQENPPEPTDPQVYIKKLGARTMIASRFSGIALEEDWKEKAEALKLAIKNSKEEGVDFTRVYRCGYDSPRRIFNRRNEIWFEQKHQ